jgi:methyl-accepting chemotaxis protein
MQSWTVGTRLLSAFSVTFVLILVLLGLYVQQSRQSNQQLNQILHTVNKKLELANFSELATTEMQGAQRGLMLSFQAKDTASAPQYIQLYRQSGKQIADSLSQLEPLVRSGRECAAITDMQQNLATWSPRFQELANLCASGAIDQAYSLRNRNKVVSAAMHVAAVAIVKEQQRALAEVEATSAAGMTRSLWMTVLVIVISLGLGVLVSIQVKQITSSLRQTVQQLDDGASQLAAGANQISASS